MARHTACGLLGILVANAASALAGGVTLQEQAKVGQTTRVLIELKAEGRYEPIETETKDEKPKTLPLKIESRLDFYDRTMEVDAQNRPKKAVRRLLEAAAAIGEVRPEFVKVRPDVALLLAEVRDANLVIYSPSGPLLRSELDVIQAPGDPLMLVGLLPEKPVAEGDRWKVNETAAKALADYDLVSSNGLEAKLETLNDAKADIRFGGDVRGSARGGAGTISFSGKLTFDRKRNQIARLECSRKEVRKPGLVESGLDVKSSLLFEREEIAAPPELSDAVLASLPREAEPRREWLLLAPSRAGYSLEHDRDWHIWREDAREVTLNQVKNGSLIAQCTLTLGPNAGKGRHQDPDQFRDDIRKALGDRFVQFLGAGEIEGTRDDSFRYKVSAKAIEGKREMLCYYYLVAGPGGDQLLAAFRLDSSAEKQFGDEDQRVLLTLKWNAAPASVKTK